MGMQQENKTVTCRAQLQASCNQSKKGGGRSRKQRQVVDLAAVSFSPISSPPSKG
jgi:hypothetical protein